MKRILILAALCSAFLLLPACADGECGHLNIKTASFAPDCDSEGYVENKCADCSFTYKSNIVAPLGHSLNSEVISPDCDSQGYTNYSCECGFSYTSDYVAPKGHDFNTTVFAPTCVDFGHTLYSCECGYSYKSDMTAPKGHTFTSETHAPSCTEMGYTEYSCLTCQNAYTADFTLPLGHDFTETVYHPTYLATGFTNFKCHCGFEYVGSFVMSSDIYQGAYLEADASLSYGVDVSKWNGEIDWQELRKLGIGFVILKAGSTKSGIDPSFESNYEGAKAAGLCVGAYFYTYAQTVDQALADAELCAGWLEGKQFEYPIYFDLEDHTLESLDRELLTTLCETFIGKLQSMGYFCGLYVNHDWLVNRLHTEKMTVYFDIWYARWTLTGNPDWKDSFGSKTGLWQYTDSGKLGSHECAFDLNVAFKDYPSIIKEHKLNGF